MTVLVPLLFRKLAITWSIFNGSAGMVMSQPTATRSTPGTRSTPAITVPASPARPYTRRHLLAAIAADVRALGRWGSMLGACFLLGIVPIGRRLPGPFLQAQHIPLPANGSAEAMSVLFENLEDCRDSFLARPVPLEFDRIRQRADGDGARLHHTLDS